MNLLDAFRTRYAAPVASASHDPAPAPTAMPLDAYVAPTLDESDTVYWVVAYWPGRRVSYTLNWSHVEERMRLAFASGATRVEVEPEWGTARKRVA